MAVAFDVVNQSKTDPGTTNSFTLTISGGVTNGYVVVGVMAPASVTATVTVGGTNAPAISSTDSGDPFGRTGHTQLFGLATGSTTGAQTIATSWTGSHSVIVFALSFSGVDQSTPTSSPLNNASDSGITSITKDVATASGDMTFGFVGVATNSAPSAPTQTAEGTAQLTGIGEAWAGYSAIGPGNTTTDTHAWTVSTSGAYQSLVNLKAAAAGTAAGPTFDHYFRTMRQGG